jgi:hypothetical protein
MSDRWTAFYTASSGLKGRLNVNGECTSVGGETFTLKRHQGHGKTGTLVLDKIATEPGGSMRSDLARTVAVTYEEQVDRGSYSSVEILPDGVRVAVQQASSARSSGASAQASG